MLPDLFVMLDGTPVTHASQWDARRQEIFRLTVPLAYGTWPVVPARTTCDVLHMATVRPLGGARLWTCRVQTDGVHAFVLRVFAPAGTGRHAVVLNGDACWQYASDGVIAEVLQRGYAFAQFNRVEIVPDMPGTRNSTGALAAWAWGYHRAVDALAEINLADPSRVAVVGHSRGGKAALLAGATDNRIALTSANNSGAGGAGCFRRQGPGAETLADITAAFPHWFGPDLAAFAGREHALPFDQHFLKALVAPRALLTTEALDDLWANPDGSWHTHCAARAVYELLGARERIAIRYRPGGHDHSPADWSTLLDFCDRVFGEHHGRPGARSGDP
jgi:dienelactone hydrolase